MLTTKILLPVFLFTTNLIAAQTRPNIIYIMADDLAYADLSCYGRKDYQTPNLDKLASQGMKFINAYSASALCTPTRTSFMTGRYPARTPIGLMEPLTLSKHDSTIGLTPDYTSLPALLKNGGYETYLAGKWHLGLMTAFNPNNNGYDEFFGLHSAAVDYISHTSADGINDLYENDKPVTKAGYMTDLILEKTLEVIRRAHPKPFFLSVMFTAPHTPLQTRGDSIYPLGRLNWIKGGSPETYAGMVKIMDEAVGMIMKTLDEEKLSANTVVIFTSDNGGTRYADMGSLSGGKALLWEGGIKVPAFICWPGKIPANTITEQLAVTMDWTATILALGNTKADPKFPLDGIDLMPVITGKKKPVARTLYWRMFQRGHQKAIRDGNWKYLKDEKGEWLFDLAADGGEKKDLKEKEKQVFETLKQKYSEWEKTVLEPVPLVQ
ncbi:MAG: sulfatase-like hydrolase/transferase [Ferruginibacter sp.]|nr:sulfatase-like hydrolase/transferase [Chitinophagaceae bacterium]